MSKAESNNKQTIYMLKYLQKKNTMELVIYDHPLVPVILVINDRWP